MAGWATRRKAAFGAVLGGVPGLAIGAVAALPAAAQDVLGDLPVIGKPVHGGMGFMREAPIERMARDARVQTIGGGATEVMLEEVAKRM